jgi:hypothetical protein
MEFKKREVKRPPMPSDRPSFISEGMSGPQQPPPPEEYSFEDKMLIVSILCEAFELTEINDASMRCPIEYMGVNYNPETRTRNVFYNIREGKEVVNNITLYWNDWTNVGKGVGKKIRYSIRTNKNKEIPT